MLEFSTLRIRRKRVNVVAFGQSDVGVVRTNNEDSFVMADLTNGQRKIASSALDHVVGEKGSLFVVADGMGGANAGEVASLMAVELVSNNLSQQLGRISRISRRDFVEALKKAVEQANAAIHQESRNNEERKGMGTTITAAAVYDGAVFFAQVGDSRGYILRNGLLGQMTQDQSLVAHLIASGALTPEEAKKHPQRNVILQALGVQPEVNVALSFEELRRGDSVVVCSDGLWGKVEAEELKDILRCYSTPEQACQQMIKMARERGGEDNITVIVARFEGERLQPPSPDEVVVNKPFSFDDVGQRGWRFWQWRRS
ncbi:MAG: Stp1/IreP family PP2C-type Ser/Thr phosphatase [Deltaproteobacteria bacterium]|nr:Stp1/IreP family PP2C-type Ser/Thr phosphatase [Deltaproteobacteria bacterium]